MDKKEKAVFTVRMPTELNQKLIEHVAKRGTSKSAFICNLVYEALEGKSQKSSNSS